MCLLNLGSPAVSSSFNLLTPCTVLQWGTTGSCFKIAMWKTESKPRAIYK